MTLSFFATITKVDQEQRRVFGYASTEALDQQGEIVRLDAIERALPAYMRFGNIREMHQPSAVGIAKEAEIDNKGLRLDVKVVDDRAWEKVREGVYKGFSIGGKVTSRDPQNSHVITGVDLTEISLVDRPANPEAVFEMFKRLDGALRPTPLQKWDCGHPGHQHLAKSDAASCMEKDMALSKAAEAIQLADEAIAKITAASPAGDDDYAKRDYSDKERKDMADKGEAESDGSYPIKNKKDLENAIRAYGRSKDKAKTKAHIVARAKALGLTDELPEDWEGSSKKAETKKASETKADDEKAAADAKPDADEEKRRKRREKKKAALGGDVAKGMHTIACLARMLDEISYLRQNSAWEQVFEGDEDSTVPQQLEAWLAQGAQLLRNIVTEETEELIDGDDVEVIGGNVEAIIVELAAKGERHWSAIVADILRESTIVKAANGNEMPAQHRVARKLLAEKVEKMGSRHNKGDRERIQKMHDHTVELGAKCAEPADKAATVADLAKVGAERDGVVAKLDELSAKVPPLLEILEAMNKRLQVVESQPLPAKGVLAGGTLTKEQDSAGTTGTSVTFLDQVRAAPGGAERANLILRQAMDALGSGRR